MSISPSTTEVLLWLSLLTMLTALSGVLLLPQNGPMKIAINRRRFIQFAEAIGILFASLFIASIIGLSK